MVEIPCKSCNMVGVGKFVRVSKNGTPTRHKKLVPFCLVNAIETPTIDYTYITTDLDHITRTGPGNLNQAVFFICPTKLINVAHR